MFKLGKKFPQPQEPSPQGLKSIGSMAAVLPGRKLTDRKVARKEGASAWTKGPGNIERKLTRQQTIRLIRYQAKIAGQEAGKPGI